MPSLSSTHAARRDYDAADELIQPESPTGVAHLARKAARDGQLPLDPGAADLSVGNASDHNDDAVPAQSIAASAAASTSEKQASSGAAATHHSTGRRARRSGLGRQHADRRTWPLERKRSMR